MRCAVHSDVDAVGYCRNCGKAMCSTCVRPVRDVLYCEECLAGIVGIPGVSSGSATSALAAPGALPPAVPARSSGSPGLAFVLGFVFPGLGAVYNGEYNKALLHLVIFTTLLLGLVEAANADEFSVGAVIVLALMLAGFVFYMAFDAMRVSQAKSTGAPINDPLNDFSKNLPIGPIILIGIGALLLLNNFRIFDFLHLSLGRLWPLFLIGAGVLMFRNRIGRS